jgi:hypothetical protein
MDFGKLVEQVREEYDYDYDRAYAYLASAFYVIATEEQVARIADGIGRGIK